MSIDDRDRCLSMSSGRFIDFIDLYFLSKIDKKSIKKNDLANSTQKNANFRGGGGVLSPRRSRGSKFFAILVLKNLLIVRSFGWVFRVLAIFRVFFEGELREESNQKHATT